PLGVCRWHVAQHLDLGFDDAERLGMCAADGTAAALDRRRFANLLFPEADDLFQESIEIWINRLHLRRIADEVQWHWSALLLLDRVGVRERSDPSQRRQRWHKEVLAPAQYVEGLDAVDATPHWLLRDGERRSFLLHADDRIAFVTNPDEVAVVDPL